VLLAFGERDGEERAVSGLVCYLLGWNGVLGGWQGTERDAYGEGTEVGENEWVT
jgi:hypothetical protein